MAGKFGVKGGCFRAQNDQAGVATITVDSSGNGSSTISFRQAMKAAPASVVTSPVGTTVASLGTAGFTGAAEITASGCKIVIKGSSIHSSTVKVAYHAFDDAYR
jgi:hypothetical protein